MAASAAGLAAAPHTPASIKGELNPALSSDGAKQFQSRHLNDSMAPWRAAAADEAPEFITSVPAGAETVYYSRDWQGYWLFNYMVTYIMTGEDYGRVATLSFDGDDVYYRMPVLSFEAPSYIKGKRTETGITFPMPQCLYTSTSSEDGQMVRSDYYVQPLYFDKDFIHYYTSDDAEVEPFVLTLQEDGSYVWENSEQTGIVDEKAGVINYYYNRVLGVTNRDDEWTGYADYTTVLNLFTDAPAPAPEKARTTIMTLSSDGNRRSVKVAFKDNDVWIQGFSSLHPEVWVKGTNTDGRVRFPHQYVGIDADNEYYGYFSGTRGHMEWNDILEQEELVTPPLEFAEFDYNTELYSFTPLTDVMIAGGLDFDTCFEFLHSPFIQGQADSLVPMPAKFGSQDNGWWNYNPDFGYGRVIFTIPGISVTGAELDSSRLEWMLSIDGEPYIWEPTRHTHLSEAMEWVPDNFTDGGYDIRIEGDEHVVRFKKLVKDNLAITLRYTTEDGEVFYSEPTEHHSYESGLTDAAMAAMPVAVVYTDLAGRRLAQAPAKGICLMTEIFADGTRRTVKTIIR